METKVPSDEKEDPPTTASSAAAGSSGSDPDSEDYHYNLPRSSPMYAAVFSPMCDWLVEYLPLWVTPNSLSVTGFLGSSGAWVIATHARGDYWLTLLSVLVYYVYPLCDNLDGKQARRMNKSSHGGEFVDHTLDSLTVSMSTLLMMMFLDPYRQLPIGYDGFVLLAMPHLLMYTCQTASVLTGTLFVGVEFGDEPSMIGKYFTADEFNFIILPLIGILRAGTYAGLWDFDAPLVGPVSFSTLLVLLNYYSFCLCPLVGVVIMIRKYGRAAVKCFVPFWVYAAVVLATAPPSDWLPPLFMWLVMELLRGRYWPSVWRSFVPTLVLLAGLAFAVPATAGTVAAYALAFGMFCVVWRELCIAGSKSKSS